MKYYLIGAALMLSFLALLMAQRPTVIVGGGASTASVDPNTVTAAGTLTSNAPMVGAGAKAAAVGTASGNTTQFATITGTKTTSKQLAFDANGNVIASSSDLSGSAPGLILLEEKVAATSASLSFTSCFTSLYDDYEIHFINVLPVTDAVDIRLRFSTNGGSSYDSATNYGDYRFDWRQGLTGNGGGGGASQTGIKVGASILNAASYGVSGKMNVYGVNSASNYKFMTGVMIGNVSGNGVLGHLHGDVYVNAAVVNAFQITASSGNIASGTVRCYGTAKTVGLGSGAGTTVVSGAKTLDTDAIASGACDTMTATATGTVSTDIVSFTPNADISAVTGYAPVTAGGLSIYIWPSADTVNFKVCNPTASSVTPGAVTLNWRVYR